MPRMRGALIALLLLLGCHISKGQSQTIVSDAEPVRQAVQSYLETTARNLNAQSPVPSDVVHPQAKIFSTLGDKLLISGLSRKPVKLRAELIKTESTDRIVSVDVTGSMAVVKIETIYPYGALTAVEYNALPEHDPRRSTAGKPRKLTSYLSLLKLGGTWQIVSFLISAAATGDK